MYCSYMYVTTASDILIIDKLREKKNESEIKVIPGQTGFCNRHMFIIIECIFNYTHINLHGLKTGI